MSTKTIQRIEKKGYKVIAAVKSRRVFVQRLHKETGAPFDNGLFYPSATAALKALTRGLA